jgi:hypothetical protein
MATTVTASRYSRTADRQGPAAKSPFRSANLSKRMIACLEMIQKREREIGELEEALAKSMSLKEQKVLAQRILASKNNLASWETYYKQNFPREPRAVIISRPEVKA